MHDRRWESYEKALDFAATQVAATIERTADYFPIYTVGGRVASRRRTVDRLDRRLLRRHDVAVLSPQRRSRCGASGPSTTSAAGAPPARPQRPRPGLHLSEHLSALVRADRRRAAAARCSIQAGRTLAMRFHGAGAISVLVRRARVAVHRHHDERAAHLLRGPRNGRRAICGGSPRPIAAPRATRWCGPTARRPTKGSSISRPARFLRQSTHQGLRADSRWARGLAWSLYGFSQVYALTGQRRVSGRGRAQRRLLADALADRPRALLGFRRRPAAAAALGAAKGHLGRGDRRQRTVGSRPANRVARSGGRLSPDGAGHARRAGASPSIWPSARPAGKAS